MRWAAGDVKIQEGASGKLKIMYMLNVMIIHVIFKLFLLPASLILFVLLKEACEKEILISSIKRRPALKSGISFSFFGFIEFANMVLHDC